MKHVVNTPDAPTPGGAYSQGVVWNGLSEDVRELAFGP